MDKKSRELVMAKLYFKNKDYKMAEKSFNEYLSMNPEDISALKLLAQVYEQNKRFDKAFEMYERCYLAEPDRTGVLLDISRILLMNEVCLDHVDYRKWLNLAIQAFPSNPITVHCKAFLSTLPSEGQNISPQRDLVSRVDSKASVEDPLLKILQRMERKIESIENKVETIETKLRKLNIDAATTTQESSKSTSEFASSSGNLFSQSMNKFGIASNMSSTSKPEETVANKEVVPKENSPGKSTTDSTFSQEPLKPTFEFSGFGGNLFSQSMNKFNISNISSPPKPEETVENKEVLPKENSPRMSTKDSAFNQEPLKPTFEFPSFGGNLFAQSMNKFNIPNNMSSPSKPEETVENKGVVTNETSPRKLITDSTLTQEPSKATFEFPGFGGNLFAQSMNKFNIPNNMSSSSKPEETVENEEVVPNEELPIENTCDMTPIEIKTGEEDEDLLFEQRCKLFRFRDKEYKERGLGSIKVLKHKITGKGRLIMRREAVGLVCLNCWDCYKIERVRETQVRWMGIDASDGEPEAIVSLVRFKTSELTDTFMEHLTSLFPENQSANNSTPTKIDNSEKKSAAEVELVEPKLDPHLVDKARQLQLPDLFYHKLVNQEPCTGCKGCENEQ